MWHFEGHISRFDIYMRRLEFCVSGDHRWHWRGCKRNLWTCDQHREKGNRKLKTKYQTNHPQKSRPTCLTTVTQVKGGIIGGVGGLIQAKGAIISAGGSALQNLGKKIAGDGDGGNNGGNIASNTTMKTILTLPTLLIVTLCT